MTTPLEEMDDKKEREEIIKKATDTLKLAKDILDDPNCKDDMTFDEFLQKVGITEDVYMKYLNINQKTRTLVLKRRVCERMINNYNKEMITAWNANMDIQLALDPYAIICYIVNYACKDESGVTKFLKEALNATADKDLKEKLKALKMAYLTHRQMGASEAAYRVIPNMKLKDSNITCTFVTTGFPENRSAFYRKVSDETNEVEETADADGEEKGGHSSPVDDSVNIQGYSGKFQKSTSVIERYESRPDCLKQMCLAQFAISFTFIKNPPKSVVFDLDGASLDISSQMIFNTETFLPRYVKLKSEKLGYLRLRSFPSVLRIHSSKKKEGHERQYSELLLFCPWKDEKTEFFRDDEKKCKELYEERKGYIATIRNLMYPGESTFELLESGEFEIQSNSHIHDALDGQREQENADDCEIGVSDDPRYESFSYTGNLNQGETAQFESFKYKKICLPDKKELKYLTCKLVPEQLNFLRKVVGYCKDVVKAMKRGDGKLKQKPLRIILHGGAGVGKSMAIKTASLHAERILRKSGDHPNHPRVLLCAPTGKAASLIKGVTLHSAFNFNFGPSYIALSSKQLAEFQENLRHLKLLIIDEMSLLGSDMLYKIHLRLSEEVFQNKELFGGISVVLVGDLLQLPPVNASFIFKAPRNSHYASFHNACPLWSSFEPMILKHNLRQGEGGDWAISLNRFREGIVTPEDEKVLRSRVVLENSADDVKTDSMNICYTNAEASKHNEHNMNQIDSPLISVQASKEQPRGCSATITDHGTIDSTRFMNVLTVKMGARCEMIYNVNTIDELVNGAAGTIVGLEYEKKLLTCIVVQFDQESCGVEQRSKY